MNLTWCMYRKAIPTGTDERTSTKTSPAKAPAGIARAANPCNTTQLDPECQEIWPMTLPAAIEIAHGQQQNRPRDPFSANRGDARRELLRSTGKTAQAA